VVASGGKKTQPNLLWILADDLDNDFKQDRMAIMPNLRALRAAGAHFVNHVAAQPVCGPSRSSLLSGRFPHNVGYYANEDPTSIANYLAIQNNSVGTWLTAAGYHSAFIGKYVNGVEKSVPSGWSFWGAFSTSKGTYNYYNATPWNVTFDRTGQRPVTPVVDVAMTGVHQADFVGAWGVEQMKIAHAAGRPFFVHTTPTMVHEGTCFGPFKDTSKYANDDPFWEADLSAGFGCTAENAQTCAITVSSCPSDRHKRAFDGITNPHVASWNASESGAVPKVMAKNPPLTAYEARRQDMGFRNRSASLLDLDDMIGVLLKGIDDLGVADNTYVIFTSDNGFHLGEHQMLFGKEHPYDHDVSLPLYIRGPGVPAGAELLYPTNHLDITATVVELAGATVSGPPLDGLSFAAALGPSPPAPEAWRSFSFTEHFENANTWWEIRRPLAADRTKFHCALRVA
jgi:arylsulfatase A-like enzyme